MREEKRKDIFIILCQRNSSIVYGEFIFSEIVLEIFIKMSCSNRIDTGKIIVLEPIKNSYFQLSKSNGFYNIVACSVFKSETKFINFAKSTDNYDGNGESFRTNFTDNFISAEFQCIFGKFQIHEHDIIRVDYREFLEEFEE